MRRPSGGRYQVPVHMSIRHRNAKVPFGARAFWDERISRLLNPVVEKGIRSLQAKDQPSADGF
jgi:hypothetical protein